MPITLVIMMWGLNVNVKFITLTRFLFQLIFLIRNFHLFSTIRYLIKRNKLSAEMVLAFLILSAAAMKLPKNSDMFLFVTNLSEKSPSCPYIKQYHECMGRVTHFGRKVKSVI